MILCDTHLLALENVLQLYGVGHLRINDAEEAECMMRMCNGEEEPGDEDEEVFDSIVAAQFLIFEKAVDVFGDTILDVDDEAADELCALCECERHPDLKAMDWLTAAAEEIREEAKEQGLIQETLQ